MGCINSTAAATGGGGNGGGGGIDDSRIGFGKESMHSGILRVRKMDVFDKYQTMEVLGQGSMGYVQRVRIKEGTEGGSAVNSSRGQRLSERRMNKVDYALKQIQMDKVDRIFLEELENEIDILRGMDHPNIVKAHEVYKHRREIYIILELCDGCLLYTSPSPRDLSTSRMPSSA